MAIRTTSVPLEEAGGKGVSSTAKQALVGRPAWYGKDVHRSKKSTKRREQTQEPDFDGQLQPRMEGQCCRQSGCAVQAIQGVHSRSSAKNTRLWESVPV